MTFARLVTAFALAFLALTASGEARALEAVSVKIDEPAIDLTSAVVRYPHAGDRLQVSTAPGADGIVRRIEVRARGAGGDTSWVVFALANNSDEQIDRLLVAPHFRLAGSGILSPDLGASRIAGITPSQGFAPEREPSQEADVFSVTLDPGSVVTFVAELRTDELPQLYLWEPNAYKDQVNSFTLFKGIVLGIAGLLAVFLTVLVVIRGTMLFPATALLAWSVLGYLAIEFGFWNKLFDLAPGQDQVYRAGAEALLAATLLIFLYAYLNLNRWHARFSHVAAAWLLGLLAIVGLAVIDAPVAASVARISLALLGIAGLGTILWLSTHGYDRAIMLIPTWVIFIAWLTLAGLALAGVLVNDLVSPALAGGLVLIVLLLAFTVMQHAFAGGALATGSIGESERKALALTGAGDIVWDWDVTSDRIHTGGGIGAALGLEEGTLEGPARDWLDVLHPGDRDRFRITLDTILDQRSGRICDEFRLRGADGRYRWFILRARPVIGTDNEVVRCVGTLFDITDRKTAEERLLHDAIHDNLTGLPNRQILTDRLERVLARARTDGGLKPTVFLIDLDRFREINERHGVAVGDSILMTIARRLMRHLKPQDTIARIGADGFAILLLSEQEAERVAAFAEALRRAVRAPITFGEREVVATASIGIAMHDPQHQKVEEVMQDAEVAMYHAKRLGGDRIEAFRPALRQHALDILGLEADLRRALDNDEIEILFQPIARLIDRRVAGFEISARWNHPRRGRISPAEFVPIAERSGLIIPLGLYVFERAARHLSRWQRTLSLDFPVFGEINVVSRLLLRHDLINDIRAVLSRCDVRTGTLRIGIPEGLVMENPEVNMAILERLSNLGCGLTLDRFGTGYSCLSYLERLPFDTLKIDRTLVHGGGAREARPAILGAIATLAHDLGMAVIADGAETEADAQMLIEVGCDFGKGFVIGRPLAADDAQRLLEREMRVAAE